MWYNSFYHAKELPGRFALITPSFHNLNCEQTAPHYWIHVPVFRVITKASSAERFVMQEKRCNRCYRVLSFDNYHKDGSKRDGLYTICKDCRAGRTEKIDLPKGWRICKVCGEAKPSAGFYRAHGGYKRQTCMKCSDKTWAKSHRPKTNRNNNGGNLFTKLGSSVMRSIWRSNPDNLKKDRDADKKYRASERGIQKRIEWKNNNPDYQRIHENNRTAKKKNLEGGFTRDDWHKTLRSFSFVCVYCGNNKSLAQDHWIPVSKGGGYVLGNIVPACKTCNSSKRNKLPNVFCDKETYLRISVILEKLKND